MLQSFFFLLFYVNMKSRVILRVRSLSYRLIDCTLVHCTVSIQQFIKLLVYMLTDAAYVWKQREAVPFGLYRKAHLLQCAFLLPGKNVFLCLFSNLAFQQSPICHRQYLIMLMVIQAFYLHLSQLLSGPQSLSLLALPPDDLWGSKIMFELNGKHKLLG